MNSSMLLIFLNQFNNYIKNTLLTLNLIHDYSLHQGIHSSSHKICKRLVERKVKFVSIFDLDPVKVIHGFLCSILNRVFLIQSNCIFLLISLNVTISWINKLLLKWKKVLTSKFFLRCGISSLNKNLVFSLNINNHYAFPTLFPLITIQEHTKKTNYPSFHQHTPKSYTNARFPFPQVFLRL